MGSRDHTVHLFFFLMIWYDTNIEFEWKDSEKAVSLFLLSFRQKDRVYYAGHLKFRCNFSGFMVEYVYICDAGCAGIIMVPLLNI